MAAMKLAFLGRISAFILATPFLVHLFLLGFIRTSESTGCSCNQAGSGSGSGDVFGLLVPDAPDNCSCASTAVLSTTINSMNSSLSFSLVTSSLVHSSKTYSLPSQTAFPPTLLPSSFYAGPSQAPSLPPVIINPSPTRLPPAQCELYPYKSHLWRNGFDDYCFPIYTSLTAFPYFTNRFREIYICSNGLISFDRPFYRYRPVLFSDRLAGRNIIAPFWADATVVESNSRIYYRLYARGDNDTDTPAILAKATKDVRDRLTKAKEEFTAMQVLVVTWANVANYPDGFSWFWFYDFGNYDVLSHLRNTFQLVLVTDSVQTYAFFVYGSNGLQWSGRFRSGVAGYVASSAFYLTAAENVVGSGTPSISQVDSQVFNRVVGSQCGAFFRLSVDPGQADKNRRKCLNWYGDDVERLGRRVYWDQGRVRPCPCSAWQAWRDFRYRRMSGFPWDNLSCFRSTFWSFVQPFWFPFWFPNRFFSLAQVTCCYQFGALTLTEPISGFASPYHLWIDPINYVRNTIEPHQYCCSSGNEDSCELFYKRRPPISCRGYRPTRRTWFFGDPHFRTSDGVTRTFNGRGEYILHRGAGNAFALQARTAPAANSSATVFSAFAMAAFPNGTKPEFALETPLYGILHVELGGNNSLAVYVRENSSAPWTNFTDDYEALNSTDQKDVFGSFVSKPGAGVLLVSYSEGTSVRATAKKGVITAVFAGSEEQKSSETRGLLGVWDDDTSDDFTARDGTTLPLNATDRQLHYEFGQTWQILANESLLYYPSGTGPADFSFPNHLPPFLDEVDFSSASPELIAACGNNAACLYDGTQTGDVEVAAQTIETETENEEQAVQLGNFPPSIFGDDVLFALWNQTVTYNFTVFDPNDTVTAKLTGLLPPGADYEFTCSDISDGLDCVFTWTPTNLSAVSLIFAANDSVGASAQIQPLVKLCGCRLDLNATCMDTNSTGGSKRFLVQTCRCGSGWEGPICDRDEDGCADFECFQGVLCIDNPPPLSGATCGPCPDGSVRANNSEGCIDINECQQNISGCAQLCHNFPLLSYTCDCRSGFTLNSDNVSCNDIDECAISRPCHQTCTNTIGSYKCSCVEGFQLDADGATCTAKETCTSSSCSQGCAVIKGKNTCFCSQGFLLQSDGSCSDVDECANSQENDCDQICSNTVGSYLCSCSTGFKLKADNRSCDDVNECFSLSSPCSSGQLCVNTKSSYLCECPAGTELLNGSCQVRRLVDFSPTLLSPTPSTKSTIKMIVPTSTVESSQKNRLVVTLQPLYNEFNATVFKRAIKEAILNSCTALKFSCDLKQDTSAIEVVVVNSKQTKVSAEVLFYALLNGEVFSPSQLSNALTTADSKSILGRHGFIIAQIQIANPTASPSRPSTSQTNTLAIAVGVSVGVILIVLLFLPVYLIKRNKNRIKVLPSNFGHQELKLRRVTRIEELPTPAGI